MAANRDYKREYALYHSKPKQKKRRAQRNKARRQAIKSGRARKGDGKDVHHVDRNPANNSRSNTRITSKSKNRSFSRKGQGKGSTKGRKK